MTTLSGMWRALLLGSLLLAGCPEPSATPRPREATACERIGERCVTPEGPIGVCSETTAPCDEPPCLACMPQH